MADFYISISRESMALQIAAMINSNNKLYKKRTKKSIMEDKADYFVEIIDGQVAAVAGTSKRDSNLSEIKHVCVVPAHRRKGLAKKLVSLAINNCCTDYVFMTIGENNEASLAMARSLNFVYVKKYWNIDHYVITVGRRRDNVVARRS